MSGIAKRTLRWLSELQSPAGIVAILPARILTRLLPFLLIATSVHAQPAQREAPALGEDQLSSAVTITESAIDNQNFATSDSAWLELVLPDGSSLTLAPATTLVIDSYRNDASRRIATLQGTVAAGLVKIVTTSSASVTPLLFSTPTGSVAVAANSTALIEVAEGITAVTLLTGRQVTLTAGGQTKALVRSGFQTSANGVPTNPHHLSPAEVAALTERLVPRRGRTLGVMAGALRSLSQRVGPPPSPRNEPTGPVMAGISPTTARAGVGSTTGIQPDISQRVITATSTTAVRSELSPPLLANRETASTASPAITSTPPATTAITSTPPATTPGPSTSISSPPMATQPQSPLPRPLGTEPRVTTEVHPVPLLQGPVDILSVVSGNPGIGGGGTVSFIRNVALNGFVVGIGVRENSASGQKLAFAVTTAPNGNVTPIYTVNVQSTFYVNSSSVSNKITAEFNLQQSGIGQSQLSGIIALKYINEPFPESFSTSAHFYYRSGEKYGGNVLGSKPYSLQLVPQDRVNGDRFVSHSRAPSAPELCRECQSVDWGYVIANISHESTIADRLPRGLWVAGRRTLDVPGQTLPVAGIATYTGGALGNVYTLDRNIGSLKEVAGNFRHVWDFGRRSGNFILNFDGAAFSGETNPTRDGGFQVRGMTSQGRIANTSGQFYGSVSGETGGVFGIRNARMSSSNLYAAEGIFLGQKK